MTLSPFLQSLLDTALGIAITVPLVIYTFLYFFQERLLFFPTPMDPIARQILQEAFPHGEVRLTLSDQLQLHGWLIQRKLPGKNRLLIYFGGNAEEVSGFVLEAAEAFPNWAILALNYRGYGESEGNPGEKNLFSDALHIYDWAVKQPDIDPKRIVLMGRSLGSGVAVQLAAERSVAGVVLVSPYDSIQSVAQNIYPYAPVGWLLKHPFNAIARAPHIQIPMLMILAEHDTVIPLPHSRRLATAWGGPYREKIMAGKEHNSVNTGAEYHQTIRAFLEQFYDSEK